VCLGEIVHKDLRQRQQHPYLGFVSLIVLINYLESLFWSVDWVFSLAGWLTFLLFFYLRHVCSVCRLHTLLLWHHSWLTILFFVTDCTTLAWHTVYTSKHCLLIRHVANCQPIVTSTPTTATHHPRHRPNTICYSCYSYWARLPGARAYSRVGLYKSVQH
jgi:hypothetical protein